MDKEPQDNDACLDVEPNYYKEKRHPVRERLDSFGISLKVFIIFLVLIFLLLILLVCVIVLAVTPCSSPEKSSRKICTSPTCLKSSANILENLNTSLDPCVDFYDFACGSWLSNHPIPPQYGETSVMDQAKLTFFRKSREIIETLPHTSDFRSFNWKIKSFYHSCMDLDSVDSAGDASLKRHIETLKGWKPIGTWLINSWDWGKVLHDLHGQYGVFPFFKISVVPHKINPIQNVIQIEPSGLGLPHSDYYYRKPDDKVVAAYLQLLKDLAQLLGATFERAVEFADEVFYFEKRIVESWLYRDDVLENGMDKMTVKELRLLSQRIDWISILKAHFPQAYISETTLVYSTSKSYLASLSKIISTTDMGSLNSYLIWTLVFHYAPSLSRQYRSAVESYKRIYTGAVQPQERWEFCIEESNKIFGLALTSYYVRAGVSNDTRFLTDLYHSVSTAFTNTLQNAEWMDNTARNLAVEKIKNINSRVTQYNFLMDDHALNKYYDMLSILKTDFFQNVQNAALFRRTQREEAINTASRKYLDDYALQSDSIYHKNINQIVLSPVFFQEMFDSSVPRYLLFGNLGSYLGHGVVQGFQEIDRLFWDNKSSSRYNDYRGCITDYYTKHFNVDGNQTVFGSIADIGGIIQSYHAFVEWESKHGFESLLPEVSYTPGQLFFISFAQTMCSQTRNERLENMLLSKQLPGKYRVTGILSQVPQFSSAFQCKVGTSLHPHSRCNLW